jgi:Rtf2 RING-finger
VLYNKDAILQYLLPAEATTIDKDEYAKILQGRIKSLKDAVEVLFETDTEHKSFGERWICPVTSKELGPAVKAVYLVPCGHAFSQEAIKEMKSEQCLQCNQSYEAENVIPILTTGKEESVFLENRIERLAAAGLTHSLKKAPGSGKKRKANGDVKAEVKVEDVEPEKVVPVAVGAPSPVPRSATPQSGVSTPKVPYGIKDAATASLTAKVLKEEEAKKKRRKMMGENETLKSLFSKSGGGTKHKDGDFMTRGYSIPANARHQ